MRISDWSSDVCSSDLLAMLLRGFRPIRELAQFDAEHLVAAIDDQAMDTALRQHAQAEPDDACTQPLELGLAGEQAGAARTMTAPRGFRDRGVFLHRFVAGGVAIDDVLRV